MEDHKNGENTISTSEEEISNGKAANQRKKSKLSLFKKQPNDLKATEEIKKRKSSKIPKSSDPIWSNPEIFMTHEEFLLNHGYQSELHEVECEDGYILSVIRIPYGKGETAENSKNGSQKRPVALFVSGIFMGAIPWVLNKDENVLAYQLADKGFDCYFVNSRGTAASRKHVKLSASSKKFWAYSWNEMGQFDLPAIVNYVLKTSGQDQLFYFGHSMGCAILYVAASYHPEIASKIKLMIAYAPAVFVTHAKTLVLTLSRILPTSALAFFHHGELYTKKNSVKFMKTISPLVWIRPKRNVRDASKFIRFGFDIVNGKNDDQIYWPMIPIIAAHLPSSVSVRSYDHFIQSYKSKEFRKFDYGRATNLKKYGQPTPPKYGFENVTFPVAIFHGENDYCVQPEDIKRLAQELPNVVLVHRVDLPDFNHTDFIFAKDVDKLLNVHVMDLILKHL